MTEQYRQLSLRLERTIPTESVSQITMFQLLDQHSRIHVTVESRKPVWIKEPEKGKRKIGNVMGIVADVFEQSEEDIVGNRRTAELVEARFAASYLYYKVGDLTLTAIGAIMGGRHHTTIIHQLNRAYGLRESDPYFKESVDKAESRIREQATTPNPQV